MQCCTSVLRANSPVQLAMRGLGSTLVQLVTRDLAEDWPLRQMVSTCTRAHVSEPLQCDLHDSRQHQCYHPPAGPLDADCKACLPSRTGSCRARSVHARYVTGVSMGAYLVPRTAASMSACLSSDAAARACCSSARWRRLSSQGRVSQASQPAANRISSPTNAPHDRRGVVVPAGQDVAHEHSWGALLCWGQKLPEGHVSCCKALGQ